MERKITEVKESNKSTGTKTKKKVDLKKVAKVVSENKETIAVVASALGTLINSGNSKSSSGKKKSTSKKNSYTAAAKKIVTSTAKKKSSSSKKKSSKSNDTVSTLVDMFLK